MRICIDATALLLRSAGVKNYIYHWLVSLRREAREDSLVTFPFFTGFGELDHERSMVGPLTTVGALALLHGLNISGLPWSLPKLDVFHASHHAQNPPRRARLTTTVHDMTCWLRPELHSRANVTATRGFGERIMKLADGILAVSENSRADAAAVLGIDEKKIEVVYPGVAEAFFDVGAEDVLELREALRLERPYVLFVGTIEPRKNVPGLLAAYAGLSAAIREEYELVVAGPVGWADQATLEQLRSAPSVRRLGYIPEDALPALTAGASALVYPSFYEGFGFPVVQAMAAGVPVITSGVSSLPEVAGDAALLVDPESTAEIRDALERLLTSPSLREQLGGRGRIRARKFRWETTARQSLEFFHRIAGG